MITDTAGQAIARAEIKIGCMTCLYRASHGKCKGCCIDNADRSGYEYPHYIHGDYMKEVERAEQAGEVNIWIDGELDFNIKSTPEQVLKDFQNAAELCGYLVMKDKKSGYFDIVCYCDRAHLLRYTETAVQLYRLLIQAKPDGTSTERKVLRSEYQRKDI